MSYQITEGYLEYFIDRTVGGDTFYYTGQFLLPQLWKPDPIPAIVFVFGSNHRGVHGAGAALTAARHYGAIKGQGKGPMGRSYAIPTKETPHIALEIERINAWADEFLQYAVVRPGTVFLVTKIGTGLAGHDPEKVAWLFRNAPANCILPWDWAKYLPYLYYSPRLWHMRDAEIKEEVGPEDVLRWTAGGIE